MSYSEDLKKFRETHVCKKINVGGSIFRYVLDGKKTAELWCY